MGAARSTMTAWSAGQHRQRRLGVLAAILVGLLLLISGRSADPATARTPAVVPGIRHAALALAPTRLRLASTLAARRVPGAAAGTDVLDELLATAPPDSVIVLGPGRYPPIVDEAARRSSVTVLGTPGRTVVNGARLWGAQQVRFAGLTFTAGVQIDHSPVYHDRQPARGIAIVDSVIDCRSTLRSPFSVGVTIRGGSHEVLLDGDLIENCFDGVGSHAQDPRSTQVTIEHCRLRDFLADALNLGGFRDLVISHDVITGSIDPTRIIHNDDIFLLGNNSDVEIVDDVISNSARMLVLISNAVAGTVDHDSNNTDVLIADDVLYGAGAVAIQSQNAVDLRVIANTMWDNRYGSLWLVRSPLPHSPVEPRTVVVDNIIQGYLLYRLQPTVESHNLIAQPNVRYVYGPDDLIGIDPTFLDARRGDFALTASSVGLGRGVAATRWTGAVGDVFGRNLPSHPSLGALQTGDPAISWGAPRFGAGS